MMACRIVAVQLLLALTLTSAFGDDIISDITSDITSSSTDEKRALQIKAEKFWGPLLQASQDVKAQEHLKLYEDVEVVIRALPADNAYVRLALSEVLTSLRRADKQVLAQTVQSRDIAGEQLLAGPDTGSSFSFFTGGQDFLSRALRHFIDPGQYSERLSRHLRQRQADLLPALRGAAANTADVLGDCRMVSKRSFDVLKYDVYHDKVPKTPAAAKDIANRLVDAAAETRHRFMAMSIELARSLGRDSEEQFDNPSATVTRALLDGIGDKQPEADSDGPLIISF